MAINTKRHFLTAIIRDKKGNILSIGKNSYIKTHPLMIKLARQFGDFSGNQVNIHAEIDAIVKCPDIQKAYSIEIYRYASRSGRYRNSCPCKICRSGIEATPIKFIKYIDDNAEFRIEKIK